MILFEDTDEIVCPYCGYTFVDSWELAGDRDGETSQIQCLDCDKTFISVTHFSVTYSSKKAECLNGGEHRWGEWHDLWREDPVGPKKGAQVKRRWCSACEEPETKREEDQ